MIDLWSDLNNKQQEKAIKQKSGPSLIIAGPGSGKTKVIIRRYLNLILNQDISPEKILLTTFTEKAADELKEKITYELNKYDYPIIDKELNIGTIHSFCNKYLEYYLDKYPEELEPLLSRNFRILTEDEQLLFIYKNLPSFGTISSKDIQSGKGWNHAIKLSSFFNKCTEEGVTWQKIQKFVDDMSDDNGYKDDLWYFGYAYEIYEELLKENDVVDYSHLQTNFYDLLSKNDKILEDIRNKISYVMVDEFQDTNYVQMKIFRIICKKHKNLMVVGDDDQSIYRFRGAVVENILSFEKFVKEKWGLNDFEPIYLNKNYRSTPMIVRNSLELIKNNDYRFEKELKADKSNNQYKHPFWIHGETDEDEARLVAEYIKNLKENDIIDSYSDIGILFRSVGYHASEYIEVFQDENIPIDIRGGNDFYSDLMVKNVIDLFWCTYSSKNSSVTKKNEKLSDNIIIDFKKETKEIISNLESYVLNIRDRKLKNLGMNNDDLNKIKKLKNINRELNNYRSILELFYDLMEIDDYLSKRISDDTEGSIENMRGISQLSRIIYDFDNYSEGRSHPSEFLRFIFALENHQNIELDRDVEKNAVSLYTIHQAKGLEWPIVIIGSAIERRDSTSKSLEDLLYPIYERDEVIEPDIADKMENRRIYYVGITRAEEALGFATCTKFQDTKADRDIIKYMTELEDDPSEFYKMTEEKNEIPDEKIRIENDNVEDEKNIISFTQLKTYIRCPKQYLLLRDLEFSTIQVGQLRFGSNIHNVLEDIHKIYQDGNDIKQDELREIFNENWVSFGFRSENVEDKFKKSAWNLIRQYFSKPEYKKKFKFTNEVEREFTVELNNCFLSGRIDLINQIDDGKYEVVDFKVGKENDDKETHKLQLLTYALALEKMGKDVNNLEVRYISKNTKTEFDFDENEINKIKKYIESLVNKIENKQFPPNPGDHCNDCAFKKYCPEGKNF